MTYLALASLIVTSLAIVCTPTFAYPNGAPSAACESMSPSHNNTVAKTSAAPFSILVSSNCYTPGTPIKVTLRSNDAVTEFDGFLMEARKPGDNTASYGVFSAAGAQKLTTINCFGSTNNAITHNTRIEETQSNFTWTPSTSLTGNIVLTTTVVEEFDEFWVKSITFTLTPCSGAALSTYSFTTLLISILVSSLML